MRNDADLNNGWRTDYPEYDGTYLVVLDDGTVTTMMYECWEGQWEKYLMMVCFIGNHFLSRLENVLKNN